MPAFSLRVLPRASTTLNGFVELIWTAGTCSASSTRTGRAGTIRSSVPAVVVREDPLIAPAGPGISAGAVLTHPDPVAPAAPVDHEERAGAGPSGPAEKNDPENEKQPPQAGQGIAAAYHPQTMAIREAPGGKPR